MKKIIPINGSAAAITGQPLRWRYADTKQFLADTFKYFLSHGFHIDKAIDHLRLHLELKDIIFIANNTNCLSFVIIDKVYELPTFLITIKYNNSNYDINIKDLENKGTL